MDDNTRLTVKDWLFIYCAVVVISVGAFLALFAVVWGTMGLPAAVAMLTWAGTVVSYAIYVVPIFVGVYLLLRMVRRHDAQIIATVANAITRHDAVDAAGDALKAMPGVVTGTDVARITEAQNLLHRTFLEQVAQTARTLGEARRPALPFAAGGGPGAGSEAEGEEW